MTNHNKKKNQNKHFQRDAREFRNFRKKEHFSVILKTFQNAARRRDMVHYQQIILPIQISDQNPKILSKRIQFDRFV